MMDIFRNERSRLKTHAQPNTQHYVWGMAMLDRIEAKASDLMFPTVRKIWVDEEGSIRIDFTGNWHIAMRDCHLSQLIKEATDPLHKRIAELEADKRELIKSLEWLYEVSEIPHDKDYGAATNAATVITKHGGDA